ncbi:MAG TPA: glycosyltransferase [Thermodesulfobacteriota bacterium]|nr:glycosyltransferase [Thermodesulfobacteriota bacterium]
MTRAFITILVNETDAVPFIAPINEISFFSWAGADVGCLNPFIQGRGFELKVQLVRATIEAIEATWDVTPTARIIHTDPVINIVADTRRPHERRVAEERCHFQYQAWDMICGRLLPQLGGNEKYLDIIGVNYYPNNQWIHGGPHIHRRTKSMPSSEISYFYDHLTQSSPSISYPANQYRHFRYLLQEVYERYGRPMFVAETGAEDEARPDWLCYIGREVRAAKREGVPIEGVCLYPIINHPGWDDDRHCHNGLWDYPDDRGGREIYEPLARELSRQRHYIEQIFSDTPDIICLSHLRWHFVFQRPQHLMSRCAKKSRVFFIEEPLFCEGPAQLKISRCNKSGVWIVVPYLPSDLTRETISTIQEGLINRLLDEYGICKYILWYYTPMAITFMRYLKPLLVIYDCMDDLSAFRGAPFDIMEREAELFDCADLVFTGGQSLYESKHNWHPEAYVFPSSVDVVHFTQARNIIEDPMDQADIPHPRLGFYGVIDERLDVSLLKGIAEARPDWHLVMIGPVVKIDPAVLPRRTNIHYLGGKFYEDLPKYLSGWDIAMLPFARNEATRFISPTKTPEYLAAGKPVISTSIRDVVFPYGHQGLVWIADTATEFVTAAEAIMDNSFHKSEWLRKIDLFLSQTSWDRTWEQMMQIVLKATGHNCGI